MTILVVQVQPEFWDSPRAWPPECRPVTYSIDLIRHNAGTLRVPAGGAPAAVAFLREHPQVVQVEYAPLPFPQPVAPRRRAA